MTSSLLSSRPVRGLVYLGREWRLFHRNARLYVISNTLQAATAGAVGVLYTLYLAALGYRTDFIGAALVIATIGGGLGIIPANLLVRRLGWRTMLIWSDIIGGVAIAVQIVVPTVPVIIVTMLGVGASVAIVLVINTPLLAAYSTPRERTLLFGINNATNVLAVIVGTLMGGLLPGWFLQPAVESSPLLAVLRPLLVPGGLARSYELALLVSGLIALPSIIPVLLMRDTSLQAPDDQSVSAREERTASSLALPTALGSSFQSARKQLQLWRSLILQNVSGITGRFSATQAVLGFGAGIIFPYVSLYFVNTLRTSVAYYGILSSLLALVVALASLVAAPLATRFGKLPTAVVVQLLSIPFLVIVGIAPWLWLVSAAYLLRGGLMAINNPPLQTFLMEAVEKDQRVLASSIYNATFQVAWALGAAAGGWLITLFGSHLPFLIAAPFYALSALLLALWFRSSWYRRSGTGAPPVLPPYAKM
ncbi:MAG: MFS transporter [Ktedonobacterales bacterium]